MNIDDYTTYNFSCLGCLGVLLFCVAAWCLLIYGTYNFTAWLFG